MAKDEYIENFIQAIKTSNTDEELKNIVNKIYEDGFEDGNDSVEAATED